MRYHHQAQQLHSVIPPALGRAMLHNVLVIAGALVLAVVALLAGLAAGALPARAQAQAPGASDGDRPIGLYFRSGEPGNGLEAPVFEAPVLKTEVDITVSGMVARATVRQVFHNPSDRWLEGIYVFPLPERSAVDRLTLRIGERVVEGRIMEKAEAERAYRAAADNGQRAGLVSGERPNVFVTSVANIGPGEDIAVEIGFQDSVAYENGVFTLRFPMVVAPRYTPAPSLDVAEAPAPQPGADTVAATTPEPQPRDLFGPVHTDGEKHNLLALTVELDAGLPLASLRSLYHPVTIETDAGETGAGHRQTITLREGEVPADRDFVLAWAPEASAAPQAALFAEQVGSDAHLLVMMVPPSALASARNVPPTPRELVFIIDTSGSMHGDSLDQAKAAVIAALKRLKAEDRFNVIQFNSVTHALFPRPVAADASNVAAAWHYVSALQAEGGTEMRPALELALAGAPADGFLQQVVFLTDGAVGNEEQLFGIVAERLGAQRLFTVGIGAAPNSYFMRKAAEVSRGSFTHIGDLREVKPRMDALFAKLEQPALTDIRVGWPLAAGKRIEIYPTPLPDLYAGEPVTFAARLEGVDLDALHGELLVIGTASGAPWQQRLALGDLTAAPGVASVWARAKLTQIEDGLYRSDADADRAAIRAQALALALEHRMVTRYTSLVAIDEAVARPDGEPLHNEEIARDLPAGWDAGKVFGERPPDGSTQRSSVMHGPAAAQQEVWEPVEMRARRLPAPLLQQAAAGGQAVTLPQTATPAERRAILGGLCLLMAALLVLVVLHRRRLGGRRG